MRWRAADILAVCVQNNPYGQNAALEMAMLPVLCGLLESDQSEQVQVKALFAISSKFSYRGVPTSLDLTESEN